MVKIYCIKSLEANSGSDDGTEREAYDTFCCAFALGQGMVSQSRAAQLQTR